MPIAILCPTCATTGNVPNEYAGKTVRCPKCKGRIQVPAAAASGVQSAAEPQTRCPFCNELIQAGAKKCKHCGEWLDPAQRSNQPAPQPVSGAVDLSSYVTPTANPQSAASTFNFDAPVQAGSGAPGGQKFCPDCGQLIRARAEICPNCGVRQPGDDIDQRRPSAPIGAVTVPILISGISNICIGLFWSLTVLGLILGIPMFLLAIFEFMLVANARSISERELSQRATTIGYFEIAAGLCTNLIALICGIMVVCNAPNLRRK